MNVLDFFLRNLTKAREGLEKIAADLPQTASLRAPNWQPAPSQANPQAISNSGVMKFFRVKAD